VAESLEELRRQLAYASERRAYWLDLAQPWIEKQKQDLRRYAKLDRSDPSSVAYSNFLGCARTVIALEELIREREGA
jgi:hypothetical protein